MASTDQPAGKEREHGPLRAWIHANPRQAALIGFVVTLLIFAIIRGFVSDDGDRLELTDTAKERWALIQTGQESFYDENGRYAESLDGLAGVEDVLTTPGEKLIFDLDLNEAGSSVEMTLRGQTILLTRTLTNGSETSESCRILMSRAGDC